MPHLELAFLRKGRTPTIQVCEIGDDMSIVRTSSGDTYFSPISRATTMSVVEHEMTSKSKHLSWWRKSSKKKHAIMRPEETVLVASPTTMDDKAVKRRSIGWRPSHKSEPPAPAPRIPAQVDNAIASRYYLRDASIEGDFSAIEYGLFNNRPACMIVADIRLVYQPSCTISSALVQFRFGHDDDISHEPTKKHSTDHYSTPSSLTPNPHPQPIVTRAFFPQELAGGRETVKETTNINPKLGITWPGLGSADISGYSHEQSQTGHRQWRVQGRTKEHDNVCDTFAWNVAENEVSIEDSVPRCFRVGMIAYLPPPTSDPSDRVENAVAQRSFWLDITIEGTLRGFHLSRFAPKTGRRYLDARNADDATKELSMDTLQSLVNSANDKIVDITSAAQKAKKDAEISATNDKADIENQINIEPKINLEIKSETQVEAEEEGGVDGCDTESTSDGAE